MLLSIYIIIIQNNKILENKNKLAYKKNQKTKQKNN